MAELDFIERIEEYIESNKSQGQLNDSCFSPQFYKKRNHAYNLALGATEASVFYFGTNGYRSYYYFKSKNAKLYLLELYLNDINDYSCIQ
jgi:hypothetical protein